MPLTPENNLGLRLERLEEILQALKHHGEMAEKEGFAQSRDRSVVLEGGKLYLEALTHFLKIIAEMDDQEWEAFVNSSLESLTTTIEMLMVLVANPEIDGD